MALSFAAGTRDYLATLAPKPRRAIREALRLIAIDPRHPDLDVRLLRKDGPVRFYRARVLGQYRIIYSPRADHTYVWRVQHRSEGYGWLDRLDP
ncbi:MAG: type II toxin-antitoxin system RelE/ParE family toxin [Candidatus Thermoplasmatota archaeon]|jgi:mRNA-degrading endonuclease RelE of RelBE toxin-antitoxin system